MESLQKSLQRSLAINLKTHAVALEGFVANIHNELIKYSSSNAFLNILLSVSQPSNGCIKIDMPLCGETITSSSRYYFSTNKMPIVLLNFHNTSNQNALHLVIDHTGRVTAPQTNSFGEFDHNDQSLPFAIIEEVVHKTFNFVRT
ncbi:TPA: hypothetical protein NVL65_003097 [Citrobacter freundii]|uniref:hypothetical protein n=1 Tax=Citrobacter freundii TaxID=546 RepID=UPI0011AF2F0B|nr:hypothetical protein [Citrobacter freundii]WLV36672.1 hypothetical protein M2O47_11600 [Citrobacter freundii]HCJ7432692.1 hypothetical protein [Citrobacter freundii]